MKRIILQAGHQSTQYNRDPELRASTGAPQEMGTNYAVVCRTAELLRARGVEVKQTDANADNDSTIIDPNVWDLCLAVHCDSDYPNNRGGGFTDYPDPATDGATEASQRMANLIADKFFTETEIERHDERRGNKNIRYYYLWKYLSAQTPCVLIEMGESIDAHDRVILNDTERCARALTRGVCNALSIPYDLPTIDPPKPQIDYRSLLLLLKGVVFGKGFWFTKWAKIKQILQGIV